MPDQIMKSRSVAPLWDAKHDYTRISLRDLVIEMSIGIADWERETRQRVVVSVDLFTHHGMRSVSEISDCINYDPIHEYVVSSWQDRPHTEFLETLAEELIAVCFLDARVEAARVLLQKPDVYKDAGAAEVEYYRVRPSG